MVHRASININIYCIYIYIYTCSVYNNILQLALNKYRSCSTHAKFITYILYTHVIRAWAIELPFTVVLPYIYIYIYIRIYI